jgi:lactoylglutathione lyase
MKTLHTAYRVTDLTAALGFYEKLGYEMVGRVDLDGGASLTMLKFPADEFVSLELVHQPTDGGTGLSHVAVQVDDLAGTVESLSRAGLRPGPIEEPGGAGGPRTAFLTDPDGYRIELVQWPSGHPDGLTAADWP